MDYHARLRAYFKSKGLKNKSVAQTLGYGEQMMSKYLNSSPPNLEFLSRLSRHYPDLDLNHLFKSTNDTAQLLEEPAPSYERDNTELLLIEEIREKVELLRTQLLNK